MSSIDLKEDVYKRKALRLGGFQLASMAFSTLGIIYSDIGMLYPLCRRDVADR